MNFDIVLRQLADRVEMDAAAIDGVDFSQASARLLAIPVRFNAVGAVEGPTVDFGAVFGPPPWSYAIPAEVAYGPYTLFALLLDQNGAIKAVSGGYGLVFRDQEKAYGVVLKREALGTDVRTQPDLTGYRLTLRVVEATGLPKALFLCRRTLDGLGRPGDQLLGVCRPADLVDYPEEAPDDGRGKYRKAVIDVVTHHQGELELMFESIRGDVERLVRTMESNRRLADAEVVVL